MPLPITPTLSLADDEIELTFIRSSGPGGQNVNKVATAVQLRFDARRSPSLPDAVATRLVRLAGKRATGDGVIVMTANRFRTQDMNRKDALERLAALVLQASIVPKRRVKTKPTKASRERRIESKQRRAGVKDKRRLTRSDWD